MKKQLLTMVAAAAMTMTASAAVNFSGYTCDPAAGTVEELSTIKITFPNVADIDICLQDAIYAMRNWDDVETNKTTVSGNVVTVTFKETQTIPGEYVIMFCEGALEGFSADYSESLDSPEFYITYNISGGGGGGSTALNFDDYTVDPEEGTVTELSTITMTFPNLGDMEINTKDDITASRNGQAVEGFKVSNSGTTLKMTFSEPQTAVGDYIITVGTAALCGAAADWSDYLDNPEEIILHYTIAGEAEELDFSNVAMPLNATITDELKEISFTFPALAYVTADAEKTTVTVGDEALAADKFTVANPEQNSDNANTLKVTFDPSIVATESTLVKVVFEAGALSATDNEDETKTGTNANPVEYVITVAPAAMEDIVFNLSSPTKPNADGEISADKQLDAFYFNVEMKGLEAVEGTEANVTIKEDADEEDAYVSTGRLEKAYGINSEYSYFSVKTNGEPKYNGSYTITIQKHAVADALWISNDMFGHTNAEQTLIFTLVDGKDRADSGVATIADDNAASEIYNLQGIRMNVAADQLPAGVYVVNGKKIVKK